MNDEKKETIFANGFYFDKPRDGAPEFVKGRMSVKVEDAITFLQTYRNTKGYINCDLLKKKDGSGFYFTLNKWEPEKKVSIDASSLTNEEVEGIPF